MAVAPVLPPRELEARVRQILSARGPLPVARVELAGDRQVSTAVAETPGGRERYFAEVVTGPRSVSLPRVHFIYVFDTGGKVVDSPRCT